MHPSDDAEFVVKLETLTSDDDMRDRRVSDDYLQTAEFPEATFTLTGPLELSGAPEVGTPVTVDAKGSLELHGVTNDISVPVEAQLAAADTVELIGSTSVALADYETGARGLQFVTDDVWIAQLGIHYKLGVGGLNVVLLLTTAVAFAVAALWAALRDEPAERPGLYALLMGLAQSGVMADLDRSRMLAREARQLAETARGLALDPVRKRLAAFLLQSAEHSPPYQRWTQDLIAAHIGSVRDVVGRVLRDMVREGILSRERGQLVILDRGRLEKEAGIGGE